MFNPERLLGQLLGDAVSGRLGGRRRRGGTIAGLGKAQLGLGLLGLAFAAYEHSQRPAATPAMPATGTPPPPPPGAAAMPPPPPPGPADAGRREQAMHLLRVMITAAHADGLIDAGERAAILERARGAGCDTGELEALDAEMRAPLSLEQVAVRTPAALRAEAYAAALVATGADTAEERDFLDRLATALALPAAERADLHARLGLDTP